MTAFHYFGKFNINQPWHSTDSLSLVQQTELFEEDVVFTFPMYHTRTANISSQPFSKQIGLQILDLHWDLLHTQKQSCKGTDEMVVSFM